MEKEEKFDLSKFLPDSLSLQTNLDSPARMIFPSPPEDTRFKLFKQDPIDVLGERQFGQPKHIPEDEVGTPIQEFYRGTNILITGGTGFIGKILIEKMIRSVPHVRNIYLLIRAKKGKSAKERFDELLEDAVFSRMKAEVPSYHSKITVVDGDIHEPGLGLSAEDRHMLTNQVNVIFHSAANVKFNEPLNVAIASNVIGSKRVIDLAKEMSNLKVYVHVSTAFSHCVHRVIEETVPRMSINYKEVLEHYEFTCNTKSTTKNDISRMMQGWPNTYTFSKAVCENMIEDIRDDLPVCIVRPSIVWTTYREPVRGWTDNIYGATGVMLGSGLGIIHSVYIDNQLRVDLVPVDYTVNCIIAAAWNIGTNRNSKDVVVYNFTSSPLKQWCWKVFEDSFRDYGYRWPSGQAIWYYSVTMTTSQLKHRLSIFFLHRLPGVLLDKLAIITGRKARLSNIYKRMEILDPILQYFIFNQWEFRNNNVVSLWNSLVETDKKLFHFDIQDVNLKEYLLITGLGVRYYYLKEKMETIPQAERKYNWLCWAHNTLKLVSGLVLLKLAVTVAHVLPI